MASGVSGSRRVEPSMARTSRPCQRRTATSWDQRRTRCRYRSMNAVGEPVYDLHLLSESGGPMPSSIGVGVNKKPFWTQRYDTTIVVGSQSQYSALEWNSNRNRIGKERVGV